MKIFPDGFTIAAVAPAGAPAPGVVDSGAAVLRRLGAEVKLMPSVYGRPGKLPFLAADDELRLADLQNAMDDPDVALIWAVRGGYGSARLLEQLKWPNHSRRFMLGGFSDITALHWAMSASGAGRVLALPMFSFLTEMDELTRFHLAALFSGREQRLTLPALRPGDLNARPLAGNLTVAASLCGTRYFPDTTGRIVILEEIGEAPYRIDRLLFQLRCSGTFDRCAGVLFGRFTDCGPQEKIMAVLEDFTARVNCPVFYGLEYGHECPFISMDCGRELRVSSRR